jgi:hypothetical protein
MEKNEPLSYRAAMLEIEKRIPERIIQKSLSRVKQKIFTELHNLSGDEYQEKLKEIKNDPNG